MKRAMSGAIPSAMTKLLLALMLIASLVVSAPSKAETSKRVRKSTTTVITKESEGDDDDDVVPVLETAAEPKESVKTATFGSKGQSGTAGCKTEELSKAAIKDLKADCNAWVKDQKSELKGKFLTSSCDESCDDCGTSLRRCSVTGSVHYLLR